MAGQVITQGRALYRVNNRPVVFVLPLFVALILVCVFVVAGFANLALPGALVVGGGFYIALRRARTLPHATLHFDGERLRVGRRSARTPFLLSLDDLRDVRFDTPTVERIVDRVKRAMES